MGLLAGFQGLLSGFQGGGRWVYWLGFRGFWVYCRVMVLLDPLFITFWKRSSFLDPSGLIGPSACMSTLGGSGFMMALTACTTPLVAIMSASTTGTLFTYTVELRIPSSSLSPIRG